MLPLSLAVPVSTSSIQVLGTLLRPVYPQKSLEAPAPSSELDRAIAEGQVSFQMLEPANGEQRVSRGSRRAVEACLIQQFLEIAPETSVL